MINSFIYKFVILLCVCLGYVYAGTFVPPTFQYDGWSYVDGKSVYLYTFTSGTSPAISHSGLQSICFTSTDIISVEYLYDGTWHNSSYEVINKTGPNDPECLTGLPGLKFDDGFPDHATYQYRLTLNGYFPPTNGLGWWKGGTTGDCFEITVPSCEETPANPKIDIEKHTNGEDADEPTGPQIHVGDAVKWTYIVTNKGDVPLSNIVVTDNQGVTPVYKEGDTNNNNLLDLTETWIYEATGTAKSGQYANIGIVTGKYNEQEVNDQDPSHYFGKDLPTVGVGSCYDPISNKINIILNYSGEPVYFKMDAYGKGDFFGPVVLTTPITYQIDPPQEYSLTLRKWVSWDGNSWTMKGGTHGVGNAQRYQDLYNQGQLWALCPSEEINPKIDIEKHTNGEDADEPPGPKITIGGEVVWTYIVTNTGNVPLANIVVTDDQGVTPVYKEGDTNNNGVLDLTETWIYTATGTAIAGQYANVGKVTGTYEEQEVTDEDPSHYYGTEKPTQKLILKKTLQGLNPKPAKFLFTITYPDGTTGDVELNLNVGTDVEHEKQLSTMPGKHIVTEADVKGYQHVSPTTVEVEVPEGGEGTAAFVNMADKGCAEGYVYTNGKPVVGAVVRLETSWLKKASKHATDANGHYYFDDVIIGIEYTLSVPSLNMSITFTLETKDNGCFYYDFIGGACNPVFAWYEGWYADQNSDDPLRYWSPNNLGGTGDYPTVGIYDSYDMDIWEYHILLAWACDVDAFVVNWYGKDSYEQTPTKGLLDAAQRLYERYGHLGFDFRIIISYNENASGTIDDNLHFIAENILVHSAYWGVRENTTKPLFVFCEKQQDCYLRFYEAAKRILPEDVQIFLNWNQHHQTMAPYVDGFYPWVQATNGNWDPNGKEWGEGYLEEYYRMAPSYSPQYFIGATWPGYDDRQWIFSQNRYIDRQDTLVYHWTWEDAFEYQPDWLLIESWNTFINSTHIEVAEDIGYKFVRLTRNKAVLWKSICARRVSDLGLLVPQGVWKARKRPLTERLVDEALVQFFQRNFSEALAILDIINAPSSAPPLQERNASLVVVEGSPAHSTEPWENAVDGDLEGWDGTATAKYIENGGTYVIFRFADAGLYMFNTIYLQTDNGPEDDGNLSNRQATDLEVLVSTSGFAAGDFVSIARIKPRDGSMRAYSLGKSVTASFVKLIIHGPKYGKGGWVQLVEFAVGSSKTGKAIPLNEELGLAQLPSEFELQQNYPNPFNPTTSIRYALPEAAEVTLTVFDLNGREICRLVNEIQEAGYHTVVWNATGYPSGLYYYRLQAGDRVATKRLVLLK